MPSPHLDCLSLLFLSLFQGELIASVLFSDVASVTGISSFQYLTTDIDKKTFRVITREPFGQANRTEVHMQPHLHLLL